MQSLAHWAHATDATVVVALLQPEPQVYDLFDDVLLLANGRIAYHGAHADVEGYFHGLGFVPPPKTAVADFLQVRPFFRSSSFPFSALENPKMCCCLGILLSWAPDYVCPLRRPTASPFAVHGAK